MRRGETVAGRDADAGGWGLPGRDATGRGAPLRNGLARRCVEASGRGVRQANARWATGCMAGKEMHEGSGVVRQARRCKIGNRVHGWQGNARWKGVARRISTAAPGEPLAHRTAGCGTLLLFGWCAEGIHLVYDLCWDAEDSVQLFVCGGVVVAEEPYYCNELVVGYLTEWLIVSLV